MVVGNWISDQLSGWPWLLPSFTGFPGTCWNDGDWNGLAFFGCPGVREALPAAGLRGPHSGRADVAGEAAAAAAPAAAAAAAATATAASAAAAAAAAAVVDAAARPPHGPAVDHPRLQQRLLDALVHARHGQLSFWAQHIFDPSCTFGLDCSVPKETAFNHVHEWTSL